MSRHFPKVAFLLFQSEIRSNTNIKRSHRQSQDTPILTSLIRSGNIIVREENHHTMVVSLTGKCTNDFVCTKASLRLVAKRVSKLKRRQHLKIKLHTRISLDEVSQRRHQLLSLSHREPITRLQNNRRRTEATHLFFLMRTPSFARLLAAHQKQTNHNDKILLHSHVI